ncbi:murein hydrolase activator EnvC family protein [Dinghuibacter silviterrae]|uniref:Septal ring factor EnvC (AmiA/AmiB activator) n=1 Tax=Dinghuibacter silviterrae TaxID=1539049 RepID=A0A4R8DQE2_9BACT|nr:peptidoglycan DD-metalloendopeptidase family protein [Dinghuibacter silviterrae]TDW99340.1 septal ring factor EnvC (AmiA/AmiB activator) [Dinghuibacter silviterrae]
MRVLPFVLLLLCVWRCMPVAAQQSRTELEKQRQDMLRELEEVNNTYNEIKKNKKESLGQLNLVQQKIRLRNREIENINAQIRAVDDSLFFINREIYRLRGDLDTLKANYAKSLIYAYKNRSSYDFLNFIFSATSFNDAVRRVEYLKSYRQNREQQVTEILKTEGLITHKARDFANAKVAKGEVLTNDSKARAKLEEEKREKDEVVAGLKSKEKELSKTISRKQREYNQLQLAIKTAVRHEIEVAQREAAAKDARDRAAASAAAAARTPAAPANRSSAIPSDAPTVEKPKSVHTSVLLGNDAEIKLASSFVTNHGRLPWPVSKGYVVAHYGKNIIEGTKLDYFNPSLTIGAEVGTPVKAVFDGVVSSVPDVAGHTVVIIKHGNYFTSYSNLSSVSVGKGDQVHTGQVIGAVAADDSGNGQIDFSLLRDLNSLDPEPWLRPNAR